MKRRTFLIGLALAASCASAAVARTYADDVVEQLTKFGFSNIEIETTWLGRIKISASRKDGTREIVLNPRTGEILRDVFTPNSDEGLIRHLLDDVSDDDHDGGDHSGSGDGGGDNSGSGGDDHSGSGDGSGHDGRDDDRRD